MIVRILGEGQYDVAEEHVGLLNGLDAALGQAVSAQDEGRFRSALSDLLAKLRTIGQRLPDDELKPSDAIVPGEDASVDEVRGLLTEEGLIPG